MNGGVDDPHGNLCRLGLRLFDLDRHENLLTDCGGACAFGAWQRHFRSS
jgi:hypothetical protein